MGSQEVGSSDPGAGAAETVLEVEHKSSDMKLNEGSGKSDCKQRIKYQPQ